MAINQWFRHDAGLMRRPEVVRMMMKHGWQGYGIYVGLLEYLFENGCGERHAVGLEPEMLAYVLRADVGVLSSVITDFGLFVVDEGMFWSDYISRSVDDGRKMQRARQQAGRQGASRRWKQKETDASDEAADSESDESPDNAQPTAEECQNDGKPMANQWQTDGKAMANEWQSYGKAMANQWQSDSKPIAKNATNNTNNTNNTRDTLVDEADASAPDENRSACKEADADELTAAVDTFNRLCPQLPRVTTCNQSRRRKLRARLTEMGGLDAWVTLCNRMSASRFLTGAGGGSWRATFDWLLTNDTNWRRVLEGNYDDNHVVSGAQASAAATRTGSAAGAINVNQIWQ